MFDQFLEKLVLEYMGNRYDFLESMLNYYNQLTLDEAKEKAVYGFFVDNAGKIQKSDHADKIDESILDRATKALIDISNETIKSRKTFFELYDLIDARLRIKGEFADLMCYDVALRIGACINIYPDEVYIQRGSKGGAEALLRKEYKQRSLPLPLFPKVLKNELPPYHVEAFLCIYKKEFDDFYNKILN